MPTQDNTNETYTKRVRGQFMAAFQDNNPNKPIEGPNGNTSASAVTAVSIGRGLWVTQNGGSRNETPAIDIIDIINDYENDFVNDNTVAFYLIGSYEEPLTVYNVDNTPAILLENKNKSFFFQGNLYIAKYNGLGIAQWATRIGTFSAPQIIQTGILQIDTLNNIYIAGGIDSIIPLNLYDQGASGFNDTATVSLILRGNPINVQESAYIIKYNSSGVAQWGTRIGIADGYIGFGITVFLFDMCIDNNSNLYILGQYDGPYNFYFYDGPGTTASLPPLNINNNTGIYFTKYNSNGIAQWVTKINNAGQSAIASFNNDVFIFGQKNDVSVAVSFFNTSNIDTEIISLNFTQGNFIAKYNSDGILNWVTKIEYSASSSGPYPQYWGSSWSLDCDLLGNIYVSAPYRSPYVIIYDNPGNNSTIQNITNPGSTLQILLIKYNNNGIAQWATKITGTSDQQAFGIKTNSNGDIFITGLYTSPTLSIYNSNGSLSGISLDRNGNENMFLIKFNSSGVAQWATRATATNCRATGLSLDSNGNIYVTGSYSGTISFFNQGSSIATLTLPTSGNFAVKYNSDGFIQFARRIHANSTLNPGKIVATV